MILLYHGSIFQVEEPTLSKCRSFTDFGKGFYTTTHFEQASKWATLKQNRLDGKNAFVSIFEINEDILKAPGYKTRHFEGATKEWLEFVIKNRQEKVPVLFDMVMGPVANDKLYATLQLYEQGILSTEAAIEQLKTHMLFDQLSFHSDKAMKELQFKETIKIK